VFDRFLSSAFWYLAQILEPDTVALEGRNVIVFPKVRVADVLETTSGERAGFNRISQKHVDYLLVSLPNFQPVMAIELDGKSHGSQKQQARDAVKDQAFNSAGVPLVRVPVSRDLSDVMLLSILEPHLKPVPVVSNARKAVSRG
jgi:Protein of unknown function (DUF2726)